MSETKQPVWKCVGHVGDCDPVSYGGGYVYVDETGVYAPEMTYFEPAEDGQWEKYAQEDKEDQLPVTVYRVLLDRPRFKTLTEWGKRTWPRDESLPACERNKTWYWYDEWYVDKLAELATSTGTTKFKLLRGLFSKDPMARAWVYVEMMCYFGNNEFDQYPVTMTDKECRDRYREEAKVCR